MKFKNIVLTSLLSLQTVFATQFAEGDRWDFISLPNPENGQYLPPEIKHTIFSEAHKNFANLRLVNKNWYQAANSQPTLSLRIEALYEVEMVEHPFIDGLMLPNKQYKIASDSELEALDSLLTTTKPFSLLAMSLDSELAERTYSHESIRGLIVEQSSGSRGTGGICFYDFEYLSPNLQFLSMEIGNYGGSEAGSFNRFFSVISELANLKVLKVHAHGERERNGGIPVRQTQNFALLPQFLESFSLRVDSYSEPIENIELLRESRNLKHLHLAHIDISSFNILPDSLTVLQLQYCDIEDYSQLGERKNLKAFYLDLRNKNTGRNILVRDFNFLPENLEFLSIFYLGNIDFDALILPQMKNLKSLDLNRKFITDELSPLLNRNVRHYMVSTWDKLILKNGKIALSFPF